MRTHSSRDLQRLLAFYDAADRLAAADDAALFATVPVVSAWSPAQHLIHLGIANGMMLKAIETLCTAETPPNPDASGPNAAGQVVLRLGRMARGRAQAPPRARPPEHPTRAEVTDALRRNRERLAALDPYLPTLAAVEGRLPHPFLGMLSTPQWLRLVRIHSEHHHAIIRDILSQAGHPAGDAPAP